MRWYNYDTGELDTHSSFPEIPDEWEPYIPILRRTEFWLRMDQPDMILKRVVFDILNQENRKEVSPTEILPPGLAIPA